MENSVDSISQTDVVIIGAGPAGLCLGYHLQKFNVNYLILEQNDSVGSSWQRMPDHLHLITLWKSNFLVEEDRDLFYKYKKLSANAFAEYLKAFHKRYGLNVRVSCKVEQITQDNERYLIHGPCGDYQARIVVDCRGYFNYPFCPAYPMSGKLPLMLHFKDYKSREQLKDFENILVVGKRLSAGQLIMELSGAKKFNLFLSIRSPMIFGARAFILNHYLRHLNFYDGIVRLLARKTKRNVEVPMDHAVKKIIEREVQVVNDIERIEGKIVYFKGGRKEAIDAIIFATGFQPPAADIKNDFENTGLKNYFYLGRNSQRTFASRFIRGIREDAAILGKLIRGILESSKRSQ